MSALNCLGHESSAVSHPRRLMLLLRISQYPNSFWRPRATRTLAVLLKRLSMYSVSVRSTTHRRLILEPKSGGKAAEKHKSSTIMISAKTCTKTRLRRMPAMTVLQPTATLMSMKYFSIFSVRNPRKMIVQPKAQRMNSANEITRMTVSSTLKGSLTKA